MILRTWTKSEESELMRITQEPMRGEIAFSFGLARLYPPPDCHRFGGAVIEMAGKLIGCSLFWHWPTGERYLSGLRLRQDMPAKPTPRLWRMGFEKMMEGVSYAWTSIGTDNFQARRILERKVSWLPRYHPCQHVTTWFIPSHSRNRATISATITDNSDFLLPGDFRHVAIVSGKGTKYILGRVLDLLGLRGIPRPGQRIQIAYPRIPEGISVEDACRHLTYLSRSAHGYHGLVISLPSESKLAEAFGKSAPRTSWKWFSQMYCVSWKNMDKLPPLPEWKTWWL